MDVVFVTANQTDKEEKLVIKGAGKSASSAPITANSPGTFATELPTGKYTITAGGSGAPATLKVGPYRASSKNDLLLP
jgi:hypothetical protein